MNKPLHLVAPQLTNRERMLFEAAYALGMANWMLCTSKLAHEPNLTGSALVLLGNALSTFRMLGLDVPPKSQRKPNSTKESTAV